MRAPSRMPVMAVCTLASGLIGARSAHADVTVEQRCSLDSLTPQQAEQRLEWARKCALTLHTGGPGDWIATGEHDQNGAELMEYDDDLFPNRSYTGLAYVHINDNYRHRLYDLGSTSQVIDPLGFFKWIKVNKRPRPEYPTFGHSPDMTKSLQLKPGANPSDCNLYFSSGLKATSFYVNGFCQSSCYTPDQEILFPDGYQRIDEAVDKLRPVMITLSPDSTLDNIRFTANDVYSYTEEIRDADHVIFDIRTASGGLLRLTNQHPVVLGSGRLVQAETLQVGDELIQEDGSLDPIIAIEQVPFHGKVYNIKPQTTEPVSNLLIAQGYVVGSARFQNDDVDYINRLLLGRAIPDEIIPQ